MQKRGWILLVIGVGVLLVILLISWLGGKRTDAAMALVFIGYTNQFPPSVSPIPALHGRSLILMPGEHIALLRATNTGSVPVQVRMATWDSSTVDAFDPPPGGSPRVLKPGESMMVHVIVNPKKRPWSAGLIYSRYTFREKLYEWTWNEKTPWVVQGLLERAFYSETVRLKCGPITNQPPKAESVLEAIR